MNKQITTRAPTRIGLFGGGTDLEPFVSNYGGRVLNMAINIYHKVTITKGEAEIPDNPLIKQILSCYKGVGGIKITNSFNGISSAGLGSSASLSVALIGALNEYLGIKSIKAQVAEQAWRAEKDLGWVSGKQDQYASVCGGINLFTFQSESVTWLPIESEGFAEWCLLVYTGGTRHSSGIQKNLVKRIKDDGVSVTCLMQLKELASLGRKALIDKDYYKVGDMLDHSWMLKKLSNPLCTSAKIDDIYEKAIKAGAIGGKVCGAGGDGHMFFVVPPSRKKRVCESIGLEEIPFSIDYKGLEVEKE
ncbi:MAG: hypothetical protein PHV11_05475 [Candidatus Bipolaricaulis sp.]|jgi:D-glycero-alpha-D-manno-heptose-7-phosphate kinase|nr:hypothetical protein [Candidatus Bipolaricaulis sp.]